jgi:hypothetical protein
MNQKDLKKAYEMITKSIKETVLSLELCILKLRCEESLQKMDDALKTANLILYI